MELTAAIEALKSLDDGERVALFTDSQYVRNGITRWIDSWLRKGWTRGKGRPVLNKDLWVELHAQNSRLQVEWRWVKAHAGDTFNEQVDQAAREAATSVADVARSATRASPAAPTSPKPLSPRLTYAVAAVDLGKDRSSWAYVKENGSEHDVHSAVEDGVTINHALLHAVVALLRSLPNNEAARIATSSGYLFDGVSKWLAGWKRRGWLKADGERLQFQDQWKEISELVDCLDLEWHLVNRSDDSASGSLVQVARLAARSAFTSE